MGLLVIQDMPAMRPLQTTTDADGNVVDVLPNEEQQNDFERQLDVMVNQFKSYPSIIIWVSLNAYLVTMDFVLITSGHLQREMGPDN